MTLSLLLALIGPITQSQASARAATAAELAAAAGQPDPSLEPDPVDPYASAEPEPSDEAPSDYAEPSVESTSYDTNITIYKWLCPAGYDYTDPESRPDTDCSQSVDGIQFDLTQTSPESSSDSATTGDQQSGTALFSDFTPGSYELTETSSPYGDDGFRICNDFGYGNPGAEPATVGEPFTFEVPSDQPFNGFCNWYNIPSGNSITIYKWLCPSGYDYQDQNADPQSDCTEALDGIEFTLSDQSSSQTTAVTGDQTSGQVVFDGLDSGDYQVAETDSDDPYDSYIIRCYTGNQDWLGDYESHGIDDQYSYSFQEGQYVEIYCNWYDIPGGNSITIYKWLCPSGYDYEAQDADPEMDCTEALDDIEFTLYGPQDNDETTATTGDDDPGQVSFDGLDPGDYEVAETDSEDSYGSYIIRCYTGDHDWLADYDSHDISDRYQYTWHENDYVQLYCNWYDVPTYNSVTIYKWLCPSGYDYEGSGGDPEADCTEALDGIEFTLTGPQSSDQTSLTTGDDDPGQVTFDNLDPGDYEISESSHSSYGSYIIRCYTGDHDWVADYASHGIDESYAYTWHEDEYVQLYCNWYNIPSYNSVTIYKWLCPSGYDYTAYQADPELDCTQSLDGIEFTLSGASGDTTATTGDDTPGQVSFEDLDSGDYSVAETPSGSYDSYVIRCYTGDHEWLADYASYGLDESYPYSFEDGDYVQIFCNWYDVPTWDNSITIYKWLCPYQYDYTDPESRPDEDCTQALDGVEFELAQTAPSTSSVTATTGDPDPGIARFSDFGPGSYELTETTTSYGTNGFRVCNDFGFGNPGAEPAVAGEPFTFEVPEDESFNGVCNWYNVPDSVTTDDTDNTITIYKWLCAYGYDYQASGSDPETDCTQSLDGVDFSLTGPQDSDSTAGTTGTTGDDGAGQLDFGGLGTGDYSVLEVPSAFHYDSYIIRCYVGDHEWQDDYASYGLDYAYPYSFTDGQYVHIYCNWYNVPGGNTITIYKWLCPYGYDYTAYQANPQLDCAQTVDGVDFTLTPTSPSGDPIVQTTGSDGPGWTNFTDLESGDYTLAETDSPYQSSGFLNCYLVGSDPDGYMPVESGSQYPFTISEGSSYHLICNWYNIPYDNSITIYKWSCPYGYDYQSGSADPYADCTEVTNAVEFTVSSGGTSYSDTTGNDGPGTVIFDGLAPGTWNIEETVSPLYSAVITGDCYESGSEPTSNYGYGDGVWDMDLDIPTDRSTHWICDWFNIYNDDPGDVTIYKWTCPAGYDIYGYGANAARDCTKATNGVRFNAEGPDYTSQTDTGDSIDGAVMFGGIKPGDYTFTETLPADTLYVFIADCTGTTVDAVHPYPLYVGNPLAVRVNPGDRIVCNWYNVPKLKEGTIVLTKYICSTPTWTSAVNCEIYEGGVSFTLLYRQSGNLVEVSDGTTGANGQLTWEGLTPGQYSVHEEDGNYCRITASRIDDGYIGVQDGTTTYVTVYNCKSTASDPGKPKPSNAPPGKFPDTGVDPNANVAPGTDPVAGASSPSPEAQDDQSDTASDSASGSAEPSACVAPTEPNDTVSPSPSASESVSPSPSPSEAEVTEASLAPSPDASVESCERGEVPANIVIDAVDMNLDLEVLETVDGVMQAPTGAEFASWYRETSRLGEEGPIVLAGHVNYWNVPEGPFYALSQLQAGDVITMTGEDGGIYLYQVRSTEQFPSDASPNELFESVDQSAGGETMVLITCGGEWDASISEYNERTVVVATRIQAGDEPS